MFMVLELRHHWAGLQVRRQCSCHHHPGTVGNNKVITNGTIIIIITIVHLPCSVVMFIPPMGRELNKGQGGRIHGATGTCPVCLSKTTPWKVGWGLVGYLVCSSPCPLHPLSVMGNRSWVRPTITNHQGHCLFKSSPCLSVHHHQCLFHVPVWVRSNLQSQGMGITQYNQQYWQ